MNSPKGRLELTWMGKDMALIPTAHGKYDYEWIDPADPRACEDDPNSHLACDVGAALRDARQRRGQSQRDVATVAQRARPPIHESNGETHRLHLRPSAGSR
jgi:hypothetical protein